MIWPSLDSECRHRPMRPAGLSVAPAGPESAFGGVAQAWHVSLRRSSCGPGTQRWRHWRGWPARARVLALRADEREELTIGQRARLADEAGDADRAWAIGD